VGNPTAPNCVLKLNAILCDFRMKEALHSVLQVGVPATIKSILSASVRQNSPVHMNWRVRLFQDFEKIGEVFPRARNKLGHDTWAENVRPLKDVIQESSRCYPHTNWVDSRERAHTDLNSTFVLDDDRPKRECVHLTDGKY